MTRQAEVVGISRVYYRPMPASEAILALMRRIDQLHLEHPFAGSRILKLDGTTSSLSTSSTIRKQHGNGNFSAIVETA